MLQEQNGICTFSQTDVEQKIYLINNSFKTNLIYAELIASWTGDNYRGLT
jgi:hypothetical protein